jgi:glyoxylase-like metal-dependent hydrolase (beta-lactamase superfamily II)
MPAPSTTLHWSNADVEVHRVVVGAYDNNVFVVRCRRTGDSVLIDAANEHELLLEMCQRLDVRRVLETHGHFDHIGTVAEIREAGYEVAVTAADAPMLKSVGYDRGWWAERRHGMSQAQTVPRRDAILVAGMEPRHPPGPL